MFHQPDLFETPEPLPLRSLRRMPRNAAPVRTSTEGLDLPAVIERIAAISRRPRYTFMVLNLIAKAARGGGSAGPYVMQDGQAVTLRDWLCDSLVPMAQRDARRLCIVDEVRAALARGNGLPADPDQAAAVLDEEVRERVRRAGRCNVSRAVSDLVRAGLLRRHYQGYRVDHVNRGAQRLAVYTITEAAAGALGVRV